MSVLFRKKDNIYSESSLNAGCEELFEAYDKARTITSDGVTLLLDISSSDILLRRVPMAVADLRRSDGFLLYTRCSGAQAINAGQRKGRCMA